VYFSNEQASYSYSIICSTHVVTRIYTKLPSNLFPPGSRFTLFSRRFRTLPLAEVDGGDRRRRAEVVELGEVAGAEGLWRRWLRPQGLAPRRTVLARTKRHSCRCPDISYQPTTEKRRRSKRFWFSSTSSSYLSQVFPDSYIINYGARNCSSPRHPLTCFVDSYMHPVVT
jgi:hypothetical protein